MLTPEVRAEIQQYAADMGLEYQAAWRPDGLTSPYLYEDGKFYLLDQKGNEAKRRCLGNFYLRLCRETIKDNGLEQEHILTLQPVCQSGPLSAAEITMTEFGKQTFLNPWGMQLVQEVGHNVLEYYRHSVRCQGQLQQPRTVYAHTGWRQIQGNWAFLHCGGALGADDIQVALPDVANRYVFPEEDDPQKFQGLQQFLEVAPHAITYPLAAMAFLSPLCEFLTKAHCQVGFLLFLLGESQAQKSTLAALTLCFFGDFDNKTLPSSFNDTANRIERQGFDLKDVLTVIDDLYPATNRQQREKMLSTMELLARAYGDRRGRGRLNCDGSQKAKYIHRGNAIISGEDIPGVAQSSQARHFFLRLKRGDVDLPRLSRLQEEKQLLAMCMRDYILWLLPQADRLSQTLAERFRAERQFFQHSGYGRVAEAAAHLALGFGMLTDFLTEEGYLDQTQAKAWLEECRQILQEAAQDQSKQLDEEDPVQLFWESFTAMLQSGQIELCRCQEPGFVVRPAEYPHLVGYEEENCYYLIWPTAYQHVREFFRREGKEFPLGKKTLKEQLAKAGFLYRTGSDRLEVQKRINGKNQWLLCLQKEKVCSRSE